jgi:hypothetical protein
MMPLQNIPFCPIPALDLDFDNLVQSQNLAGKVKSSKFKECEFRVMRRTFHTTQ